jgi:hypothetical protein
MRNLLFVLIVIVFVSGCTQSLTKDTATNNVLDNVPKCSENLETINKVMEANKTEDGFIIKIQQDCEPKNGEGPEMHSTFTYAVAADEIKLIGENGSTNGERLRSSLLRQLLLSSLS